MKARSTAVTARSIVRLMVAVDLATVDPNPVNRIVVNLVAVSLIGLFDVNDVTLNRVMNKYYPYLVNRKV